MHPKQRFLCDNGVRHILVRDADTRMHYRGNTLPQPLSRRCDRSREDNQEVAPASTGWTGPEESCLGRFMGFNDALLV
jgi:hypothetical protein